MKPTHFHNLNEKEMYETVLAMVKVHDLKIDSTEVQKRVKSLVDNVRAIETQFSSFGGIQCDGYTIWFCPQDGNLPPNITLRIIDSGPDRDPIRNHGRICVQFGKCWFCWYFDCRADTILE